MSPRILFEDTHLVVLSKPAGLLSQGEITGDENLVDWLRGHFGRNYVGLVHRLDRNTSGLMVVAKRSKSADRLTQSLKEGELARAYLAWVSGHVAAPVRWEHHLLKDEATNRVRAVKVGTPGAKPSALRAEPRLLVHWRGRPLTLLALTLETGRSHQIRVQAAASGHPLLGDLKYGGQTLPPELRDFGRPALHSAELSFPHPMGGEPMRFEDPLPADMERVRKEADGHG